MSPSFVGRGSDTGTSAPCGHLGGEAFHPWRERQEKQGVFSSSKSGGSPTRRVFCCSLSASPALAGHRPAQTFGSQHIPRHPWPCDGILMPRCPTFENTVNTVQINRPRHCQRQQPHQRPSTPASPASESFGVCDRGVSAKGGPPLCGKPCKYCDFPSFFHGFLWD